MNYLRRQFAPDANENLVLVDIRSGQADPTLDDIDPDCHDGHATQLTSTSTNQTLLLGLTTKLSNSKLTVNTSISTIKFKKPLPLVILDV